jgi:hypothetical protein
MYVTCSCGARDGDAHKSYCYIHEKGKPHELPAWELQLYVGALLRFADLGPQLATSKAVDLVQEARIGLKDLKGLNDSSPSQ